jgi:PBP1b-binding outer membrane lipoprotein LpoB
MKHILIVILFAIILAGCTLPTEPQYECNKRTFGTNRHLTQDSIYVYVDSTNLAY